METKLRALGASMVNSFGSTGTLLDVFLCSSKRETPKLKAPALIAIWQ
jgi:hypothetical protein